MPLSVTTVSATNVDPQTVDLTGDVTDLGGHAEVEARFQYRQTGSTTWIDTEPQVLTTVGQYTQRVEGLLAGTDYEFRATVQADNVFEVDHFERGTVTDGTYNGQTTQFAVVDASTTPATAMQGTKVLEMTNMTDGDRIWSVPANGLPHYPASGEKFVFEVTHNGGGADRFHFNLSDTSNYNDLRIRWALSEVQLADVGGGGGDYGVKEFNFNNDETLTVEIYPQTDAIDVTIYREDGSVAVEFHTTENWHNSDSGFAWRTWVQGTGGTWIGGAEAHTTDINDGSTLTFTTAVSAGTVTESWSTQTDWDAARDRQHLVSRAIGDRSPDILQQGYDTNYAPFNDSLVLYLTYDESTGTVVDYSPNTNDATLNGSATFDAEGVMSSTGATVDGVDSYFESADSASFNSLTDAITVVATYKPPATGIGGTWNGLIGKGDTTWQMRRRDSDDRVTFNVRDSAGNDIINGDSNSGLSSYDAGAYWTNGEWNQTVGSYSAASATGKFYHNGTLYNTDTSAGQSIGTNTQPVQYGANLSGTTYRRFWEGGLEEMLVFNRQLTDTEVSELWDSMFNGYFLSDKQLNSYKAINLDTVTTLPTDTSLDITVHQDFTGDGTSDHSQTISLAGGTESNTLAGFRGAQGAEYWFEANFATTNKNHTAQIDSVSIVLEEESGAYEDASLTASTSSTADSTAASSETADGPIVITKGASETGRSSDAPTHSMTLFESASETGTGTDAGSHATPLNKSADDTGTTADSGSHATPLNKSADEAGTTADSGSHAGTLAYSAGDTGIASESIGQTVLLVETASSQAVSGVQVSAQHTVTISPTATETGSGAEAVSQPLFLVKSSDALARSVVSANAQHNVVVVPNTDETASTADTATSSLLLLKNSDETGFSTEATQTALDVTPVSADETSVANEVARNNISYTGASTTLSSGNEQATLGVTTITEVVTEAAAAENASVTISVVEETADQSSVVETAALTFTLDNGAESVIERIQHVFHVLGKYENVHNVKGVYLIVRAADGEYKTVFNVKGIIND